MAWTISSSLTLMPPAAVLGVEHAALHDLVPDLVPDPLVVLEAHGAGVLPLAGVDGLLDDALICARVDAVAVHLAHGRAGEQAGASGDAAEIEHQPGKEGDGDHHHEGFGRIAKGLHQDSNPRDFEKLEV